MITDIKIINKRTIMKKNKIYYLLFICMSLCFSSIFISCDDDEDITQQELPYLFRPINFNAETRGTQVTLTWAAIEGAVSYTVEIFQDSLLFQSQNMVASETVSARFFTTELAGATLYSARVRANAEEGDRNSKFNEALTFKTPSENLFNGYTSSMQSLGTASVNWLPGSNVSHLLFKAEGLSDNRLNISAEEVIRGNKVCSSLPNASYTVEIYNNTILRGSVKLVVEGNAYLKAGDDLVAAMNSANAGDVIVLEAGAGFSMAKATYLLNKNIKVKGISSSVLSVMYMADGSSSSASMLGFADGSRVDKVAFENIDLSGLTENSPTGSKIGYLFNNNTTTTVGEVSFKNCILRNFGNTPMRLQGNKNQTIDKLIFDGCIIYDIGFASTYAIVNSNTATDLINNITFTNCTAYNFKGSLVLRQNGSVNNITVENCTFNQGMMDEGSSRYLIDCNNATLGKISIARCIFGETSARAAGVRPALDNSSVSGCYYTSNYTDDASFSIKSIMSAYGKPSADLWNSPTNGNFTFKDVSFAGRATAGDPRWR